MASGDSLCTFVALSNQPPGTLAATYGLRNSHPVLKFDSGTNLDAIFAGILPRQYAGGGITVTIQWVAATDTSGDCVWLASFERMDSGGQDIDSDGFAGTQTATSTANATSGVAIYTAITFTDGAQMASLASGEAFRLKVTRDAVAGGDTMAGDAQLLAVELIET